MNDTFWATELQMLKQAGVGGRIMGHGLATLGTDIPGMVGSHYGYKNRLEEADLTPVQQEYADANTGFGSGLRGAAYSAVGGLAGGVTGHVVGNSLAGLAGVRSRVPGQVLGGVGALAGAVMGGMDAGATSASHRLQEMRRYGLRGDEPAAEEPAG